MLNKFREIFNMDEIDALRQKLNQHPVYEMVVNRKDLDIFMRHHIFSVWDFMSLVKFLQYHIAPATWPWFPADEHTNARRFINMIVLEEESDITGSSSGGYTSHYEMYLSAMTELDISTREIEDFGKIVLTSGIDKALESASDPAAALKFVGSTFEFIKTGKPHVVAAAFALGREKIIPDMFRQFIADAGISRKDAPSFYFYLERHIHLDEDFHAPLSMKMLEELCENNTDKILEAKSAAIRAIEARIAFWDGVARELKKDRDRVLYLKSLVKRKVPVKSAFAAV